MPHLLLAIASLLSGFCAVSSQETSPSPAPSADPCASQRDAFDSCASSACTLCRNPLVPEGGSTCAEIKIQDCNIGVLCPDCAPCLEELVEWDNCNLEGSCPTITCNNTGPTSAPSLDPCASEYDTFALCTTDECTDCRNALTDESTCADVEFRVCSIGTLCPDCAPCKNDLLVWTNCVFEARGNCESFTCDNVSPTQLPTGLANSPTPKPTPLRCPDENEAYWGCVAQYAQGDSTACIACRSEFAPDVVNTCPDSEFLTCRISEQCPMCGPCHAEQVAWTNCLNQGKCEPFTCSSERPTGSPTPERIGSPSSLPTLVLQTPLPSYTQRGNGGTSEPTMTKTACARDRERLDSCLREAFEASNDQDAELTCQKAMADFEGLFAVARTTMSPCDQVLRQCSSSWSSCNIGDCATTFQNYMQCQADDAGCTTEGRECSAAFSRTRATAAPFRVLLFASTCLVARSFL
jgi:hypothetical protein